MKVLITGGTGVTSSGAQAEALARGYELYLLNRGNSNTRVLPGAKVLSADYTDEAATKAAIGDLVFDAVVDFRVMNVAALEKAVRIFSGHTKQYIFISSGTVAYRVLPIVANIGEAAGLAAYLSKAESTSLAEVPMDKLHTLLEQNNLMY